MQKLGQITNADIYLNDADVRGRMAELDLGEIAHAEVEHAALGMIGVLNLPGRPLQAIKGKLNFDWVDEALERDLLSPTKLNSLQLHSFVDVFNHNGLDAEQSHTLVTHIAFMNMKSSGMTPKLGDQMKGEKEVSITSFKQKVYGDDTPIIEIDVFAGIYNINGVPVWPR